MTTRMPNQAPGLQADSLGPLKADLEPYPDDTHYWSSQHINQLLLEFIAACELLLALKGGGKYGTLQAAYDGGTGAPSFMVLDPARGGVFVRDAAPSLSDGTILLGVVDTAGVHPQGFTAKGLRLRDGDYSIFSSTSTIAMNSGAAPAGSAYDLDTSQDFSDNRLLRLRNLGAPVLDLFAGAAPELFLWGAGKLILTLQAVAAVPGTLAALRLAGYDAAGSTRQGCSLLPQSAGIGNLGGSSDPWGKVFSRAFVAQPQTIPFAAAMNIDAAAGQFATATLTANVTSLALTNFAAGQRLVLRFRQDATGGRKVTLPAAVRLAGGVPFALSPGPGAEDLLVLESDGATFYETARHQQTPPEKRVNFQALAATDLLVLPHDSAHCHYLSGTLSGAITIELSSVGAVEGDVFRLVFIEAVGVTTSATFTLSVHSDAHPLLLFDQAKTLKGELQFVFLAGFWLTTDLRSYSYA